MNWHAVRSEIRYGLREPTRDLIPESHLGRALLALALPFLVALALACLWVLGVFIMTVVDWVGPNPAHLGGERSWGSDDAWFVGSAAAALTTVWISSTAWSAIASERMRVAQRP